MPEDFIKGAIAMGCLVSATFFYSYWRKSGDRFFLFFAGAFLLMTLTRIFLALFGSSGDEPRSYAYLIRLMAFLVIIYAIIDKNRKVT
jgi:hypothetical protein